MDNLVPKTRRGAVILVGLDALAAGGLERFQVLGLREASNTSTEF